LKPEPPKVQTASKWTILSSPNEPKAETSPMDLVALAIPRTANPVKTLKTLKTPTIPEGLKNLKVV
jgi:hypothetical protein